MRELDGGQFAVKMRDVLRARLARNRVHFARSVDRFLPVLFLLEDFKQKLESLLLVLRALQFAKQFFGSVKQTGFQVVLREFVECGHFLLWREVGPVEQVLVHADRALHFAAAAEQAAECEMQLDGLRIDLDDFDERLDGLVRLLVQEKIEPLEIRQRQCPRFGDKLLDVHPRGKPAESEKQRKTQKPPEFKFHDSNRIPD